MSARNAALETSECGVCNGAICACWFRDATSMSARTDHSVQISICSIRLFSNVAFPTAALHEHYVYKWA
ncbi:unnamed protein product [Lasius platythorax]|uniref:Uncharacterized protein n=1 Tax=Lasius platythorax TaxID=488582 RepID=A0AAV2N499_9HYME